MKNKSYIGISFIILVFGIIFIPKIITRIQSGTIVQNDRMSLLNDKEVDTSLVVIGNAPSFELKNQNGKMISDKQMQDKVYVLEFFFSTCPSICPIMNSNMKKLDSIYGKNNDFAIASITINPENDTPEVLKKHAQDLKITNPNWHFLTGDKKYIHDLSNNGFNIFAAENSQVNGGFEHSGLFALIDKNGKIRCRKDKNNNPILYYDGLQAEGIEAIKEDIKKLLEE
ncbi:MAG: SCO family protein [Flavobacterium sp.]|nr:SCO family protein [Flavobacterium sp.]MBP6099175.1 SCO family protein [Flavobacterium sp.]